MEALGAAQLRAARDQAGGVKVRLGKPAALARRETQVPQAAPAPGVLQAMQLGAAARADTTQLAATPSPA